MILRVRPARSLRGTLTVPGDKSISHRAFLIGSLARGVSQIFSPLDSQDVRRSRRAMEALGVSIRETDGSVRVEGNGPEALRPPASPLDMGNSGTTTRLLIGILAGRPFPAVLFGDDSLSKRPMRRVTEPLLRMGARFEGEGDRLPLTVRGGRLRGIRYEMPVSSAQVKSALLLAGLQAEGPTTVVEPIQTRDHTERMLRYMGAKISVRPSTGLGRTESNVITIEPGSLISREIRVPGDFSSAAFFFAAAAMVPGSSLTVRGVGLNPTRTGFLDLLKEMGAKIEVCPSTSSGRTEEWEPVGDVTVSHSALKGITVEPERVPNVIDELPILMAVATQAQGITRLRGVGELRVKETDRIQSMVTDLSALGARIREEEDGVCIEGPVRLRGAEVDSFGDHRTAMAMAVVGLAAEGETVVQGSEWIDISFPEFPRLLESIRQH